MLFILKQILFKLFIVTDSQLFTLLKKIKTFCLQTFFKEKNNLRKQIIPNKKHKRIFEHLKLRPPTF